MTLFIRMSELSPGDYPGSRWVNAIIGLAAVVGVIFGFFKWVRPAFRKFVRDFVAARDSLIGRDEIRDSITDEVKVPALPGIGKRVATIELAVATLVQQQAEIAQLKSSSDDHRQRIEKLEAAALERAMSHAESAQAFKTIETAIKTTPPPEIDD